MIFLYFQKGAIDCCKYYLLYAANRVTCGYVQAIDTPDELLDMERIESTEIVRPKLSTPRIIPDTIMSKVNDPSSRLEAVQQMGPNGLMGVIVRERASSTLTGFSMDSRTALGDDHIASVDAEANRSMQESNAVFLLDYIMDTSDEPGVSPEEATRKRKQSRRERGSELRASASITRNSNIRGSSISNMQQKRRDSTCTSSAVPPGVSANSRNPIHEAL